MHLEGWIYIKISNILSSPSLDIKTKPKKDTITCYTYYKRMPFIGGDVRVKPDTTGDAVKKLFFFLTIVYKNQKNKEKKEIIFLFLKNTI